MAEDVSTFNGEPEHLFVYMLQNDNTKFYRNKEEFQWAKGSSFCTLQTPIGRK